MATELMKSTNTEKLINWGELSRKLSGGKNILKISEDIFGVVINLSLYLYR